LRGSHISLGWFSCGFSVLVELKFGVLVFEEGGKPENPEKNPRSKDRGLFPYRNLLAPQTLFSIVHTDREPGTDYSIIQDVALFRNKPSHQVMTKEK